MNVTTMKKDATRTVLIVQSCSKALKVTSRAVAATGALVVTARDVDEGTRQLEQGFVDLLLVDWESSQVARHARRLDPLLEVILLTDRPLFERHGTDIMGLPMSSMIVNNILAQGESTDWMSTRELVTTVAKLFTNDIFGLEKYLNWGAVIQKTSLDSSAKLDQIVDEASTYASQIGMLRRNMANLGLLVSELLMNAIWDAPVDENGNEKYADRSRAETINLLPTETVTINFGSDGDMFGVSVSDPFGRLDRGRAVGYIRKCFRRGGQQVAQDGTGSGLGLYMAYNSVSSFIINVDPGTRTEVIGLIRLARQQHSPEVLDACRSLCYFRTKRRQGEQ